jgi:cobaltochelatase CobN
MLVFLTTADTEIAAAAGAAQKLPPGLAVRCANPAEWEDHQSAIEELASDAHVVLVRLLGGRRAWPEGFDFLSERLGRAQIPLLAFGGEAEPEAEMTAASTVPGGVVAEAFEYLRQGGVDNMCQLFRFVCDTVLREGFGFEPPTQVPDLGVYAPGRGDVSLEEARAYHHPDKPTVGLVFYRTHRLSGNTAFVDALMQAIEDAGANALSVWCYSLRPGADGTVDALELLRGHIDALITTVLATGGSNAGDAVPDDDESPRQWLDWDAKAIRSLDVPVLQGICSTSERVHWEASDSGLTPLDAAMQVAIPEFDGRIIAGVFAFKERDSTDSAVGAAITRYVADPERTRRLASIAARHARLRHTAPSEARLGIVLSSYPTRHSRVGNAVGLDTPRSAIELLERLEQEGYQIDTHFQGSDELIHSLIASGAHDPEFLTESQLSAASFRLDSERYCRWFSGLPQKLRQDIVATWGQPPGDLYLDGNDIVVAGLSLGNVFVAIQPPRGFGDNPVAIYHDPELPPTHHYLATYLWLDQVFGCDAVVHLGKHGTLEWLPGKALALSDACAPDAALGSVPLFYPFVVNDPGEGEQAKRRAHAVIVDHLIAPMMRAETYDELAQLEQLLDDYAQVETLDPSKLPAITGQIWELLQQASLDSDLGISEKPDDFSELVTQLDGYLCEIKDLQVRDGLHVLGMPPSGEQRLGLLAAILRLGQGSVRGLREAIATSYGLDEKQLVQNPTESFDPPQHLCERFGGPVANGSDLLDRLENAQRSLLERLEEVGFDSRRYEEVATEVLGTQSPELKKTVQFACQQVVPALERTTDELDNLIAGLRGQFVPSGPSGSPTRGLTNVLPTGRNFYSVDPKSLPSELSYEAGWRLAQALLDRHLTEASNYPETVGIVVWGTANMRTQGDDISEILALLGVRPRWNPESRRVVGLEVISLEQLGRPRIDVCVRISGFFRDAFPNLIDLIDEAVTTVASLDEPDSDNFVKKHARHDADKLQSQQPDNAWRQATTRIFGSKPGAYGAGLLPLIDAGNWHTDSDLAEVFEVWGGYAYGRGLDGSPARQSMRDNFTRIQVAVKNIDTKEHDIFDSDDFFQYHGGMVAAVRALTGHDPKAYIGDSADPAHVHTRSLAEEAHRVFRARVANPRWIASMMRHGYKGAFELSATVDYLFGYDATAGVVEDWMYESLAEKYALDTDVRDFMQQSNPWALRAVAERLIEAADRGLWKDPQAQTLQDLREAYLRMEGELEEVSE